MVLNVTGYTPPLSSVRRLESDEVWPVRQSASVRLLAVDPHELIIWGLRTVLTQQPWVERCLQATDLTQAGVLAARYSPHVIMVDGTLADDAAGVADDDAVRRDVGGDDGAGADDAAGADADVGQ